MYEDKINELKEERESIIKIHSIIQANLKFVNNQKLGCTEREKIDELQKQVDFLHYRKLDAEKRLGEINATRKRLGRLRNAYLLKIKSEKLARKQAKKGAINE